MAYFLQRLFLFFLFYLLTESSASGEDSVPLIVTGILGESVILPLKIPKEHQITYVAWNSQRSLATLITEEGNPPKIIINPYYKERVDFLNENNIYSPRISHLKMEDAGSYTAEITMANIPNPIRKLFNIFIHERLTKPKIMSDTRINDNGTCLINVTCFVEQVRENVTYNWIPLGQRTNVTSEGHVLHIRWKPGDHDQYTCTARNPVSNSTYTILASKLCEETDAGDQKCTTYESISNLNPAAIEITEYATVSHPKKNIQNNLEALNTVYVIVKNPTMVDKSNTLEKKARSSGILDFGQRIGN
ncbi:SLAM family member 5 isoform X2 [Sarcophilus harrisii]|uniref:SLAM family member 5 isoform X2 n=1 Tax=Sarcophilus harrisii TaxID=9305 RepID=UPI000C7D94B8|nr:SLAM family member 5 isoform X2 [Sarcophilus harrisii]